MLCVEVSVVEGLIEAGLMPRDSRSSSDSRRRRCGLFFRVSVDSFIVTESCGFAARVHHFKELVTEGIVFLFGVTVRFVGVFWSHG